MQVDVLGDTQTFTTREDGPAPRTQALTHLQAVARQLNRPIQVTTTHPTGTTSELVVTPAGDFYDPADPHQVNRVGPHGDTRAAGVVHPHRCPPPVAAEMGWRGVANRLGLHLPPGPTETTIRRDITAVRQQWDGPCTNAIANGKGSANKTPTTALLAAVFARHGGAGVLAWDNNETRGSLAWRTEQAHHDATVLNLLPAVDHLMGDTAQVAELSTYVHHRPVDKYDVLASDQSAAGDHEVTAVDVERIHRLAARYYRLIVMDSGNNERANNWRTMIHHAHTLVVPCTNVEDTAEAAARMLEALHARDEHSHRLAASAIVVISQRTPGKDPNMDRIADGLQPLVRDVFTIPYDPAMITGTIRYDNLRPATQRAWLHAAVTIPAQWLIRRHAGGNCWGNEPAQHRLRVERAPGGMQLNRL